MTIAPKTRAWLLCTALLATLIAAFAPAEPSGSELTLPSQKPRPSTHASVTDSAQTEVPTIAISRPEKARLAGDPFSNSAWQPPPAPPARPEPPPAPLPPQQPYAYLGRLDDADRRAVLLGRGERSLTARAGETLEGAWRLEAIRDDVIEFTHLPTNTQHTLPIGSTS